MDGDQISTQVAPYSAVLTITAIGKVTARPTGMEGVASRVHKEADKCIHATCTWSKQGDKGRKGKKERKDLTVWLGLGASICDVCTEGGKNVGHLIRTVTK